MFEITYLVNAPKWTGPGRPPKVVYPFDDMQPGASFLADGQTLQHVSASSRARAKRFPGEQYICRSQPGGVRVWRIQ